MEATRKASICVGLLLLIGFIISVIMVYHSGSSRSSYKSTVEETWKQRELRKKEKQHPASHPHIPATVQEANVLAEELQKLFVKTSSNGSRGGANDSDRRRKDPKIEITPNSVPSSQPSNLPSSILQPNEKHKSQDGSWRSDQPRLNLDKVEEEVDGKLAGSQDDSQEHHLNLKAARIIIQEPSSGQTSSQNQNQNAFYPNQWPSITPKRPQQNHHMNKTNNNLPGPPITHHQYSHDVPQVVTILKKDGPPSTFPRQPSGIPNTNSPAQPTNLVQRQRGSHPYSLPNGPQFLGRPPPPKNWNEESPEDDNLSLLDDYEYPLDPDERDDEEPTANTDPLKDMLKLFQVVNNMYKFGPEGTNFSGLLKVINDTVQGSNNTGLLSRLNKLYTRPKILNSPSSPAADSAFVGRNAYENSLSAFVFMSFGIFLLKQIHNFAGGGSLTETVKGRNFQESNLLEESELNFLFQQPNDNTHAFIRSNPGESLPQPHLLNATNATSNNNASADSTMNSMFRAALNLVNAYTKSDEGVECIWSKYCQDLDKTAAKEGSMYSMAARINSIGLRLIMGQIPTELTINAMLQSLLGWDGLPCSQMFPKCQVDDGSVKLQMKFPLSPNRTSSQTAESI